MASDLSFFHKFQVWCSSSWGGPGVALAGPHIQYRPASAYPGCLGEIGSGELHGDTQRSSLWLLSPRWEGILCPE